MNKSDDRTLGAMVFDVGGVLLDDQEVNVVAAARVGMESSVSTGPEPVRARLGLVGG